MTYIPLRRRKIDALSIDELCKPLSATVLPQSALFSPLAGEKTEARAIQDQRRVGHDSRKQQREPLVCVDPGCGAAISRQSRSKCCPDHLHGEYCRCTKCNYRKATTWQKW